VRRLFVFGLRAMLRSRTWLRERVGLSYESQIGPNAGIPRRSKP
jgi:hypothetical protein